MAIKRCVICDRKFEAVAYNAKSRPKKARHAHAITCSKKCQKSRKREWWKINRKIANEYSRKQRELNPEVFRNRNRKWRAAHPERVIASMRKHYAKRSAVLVVLREFMETSKQYKTTTYAREYSRKRREKYPDETRSAVQRWVSVNRDAHREACRIYSAKATAALKLVKQLQKGIMP